MSAADADGPRVPTAETRLTIAKVARGIESQRQRRAAGRSVHVPAISVVCDRRIALLRDDRRRASALRAGEKIATSEGAERVPRSSRVMQVRPALLHGVGPSAQGKVKAVVREVDVETRTSDHFRYAIC